MHRDKEIEKERVSEIEKNPYNGIVFVCMLYYIIIFRFSIMIEHLEPRAHEIHVEAATVTIQVVRDSLLLQYTTMNGRTT